MAKMNFVKLMHHLDGSETIQHTQTVTDARSTAKPVRHFGINPSKYVGKEGR